MCMMEETQAEKELTAELWRKIDESKRINAARMAEWNKGRHKRDLWLKVPVADIKAIGPDPYTAVFLFLWLKRMLRKDLESHNTGVRGFSYVECEKLFGVNHQAAYKALRRLEAKGFIAVDWRSGAKPRVTIRPIRPI